MTLPKLNPHVEKLTYSDDIEPLFRCVNKSEGCRELLRKDQIEEHQRNCKIESYHICPICGFNNKPASMLQHFNQKHKNNILEQPWIFIDLISAFSMYKKQSQNKQKRKSIDTPSDNSPPKKNKKISHKPQQNGINKTTKPSKDSESNTKSKNTIGKRSRKSREKNGKAIRDSSFTEEKLEPEKEVKKVRRIKPKQIETTQSSSTEDDDQPPILVPITDSSDVQSENVSVKACLAELNKIDPSPDGLNLFKWLIAPVTPADFFNKYWESEALHISRETPTYYSHLLSTQRLDDIFREFPLYYTRNVDVVSYENGVKEVHNEEGRVVASGLYDYYLNGCSVRVLNPHTYDLKVQLLLSTLQEYFGTMVGANVYLTPPGSQGFAPHYDDIEAFVVQLEGRKHWKMYKPQNSDILARDSSPNFKSEDLGEPSMEVTLNSGDLLYFPRGTIHEGRTDDDAHSLHITVSVYQHNSYADLLEHVLPVALKKAAAEDLEFRRGLPLNFLKHVGHVNRKAKSQKRTVVKEKVHKLMKRLVKYMDIDQAADQLGRKFMYDSLAPVLSKQEANYTSKFDGDFMKNGKVFNRAEIGMDTEVRLVRYHCLRLVMEETGPKIYYNTENAKVYHGEEEQSLSVDQSLVACVKKLQHAYPRYLQVEELPAKDGRAKAQLVSDLWERGLLVTNGPLLSVSEEGDEEEEGDEQDEGDEEEESDESVSEEESELF